MKKVLTILILLTCISVMAQNNKTAYNVQRGLEEAQKGNNDEAFSFLLKELKTNPTNGYASLYITAICKNLGYKAAVLSYGNMTINLLGKKEPEFVARVNLMISDIYLEAGDTLTAIDYMKKAIATCNTLKDSYGNLAAVYDETDMYSDMKNLGQQYSHIFPQEPLGYIIWSNAEHHLNNDKDALALADLSLMAGKTDNSYEKACHLARSHALFGLGRYEEALTEAIKSAKFNMTYDALQTMINIADSVPGDMVTDSLQKAWEQDMTNTYWLLTKVDVYLKRHQIQKAIVEIHKALKMEENAKLYRILGDLYINYVGIPEESEKMFLKALQLDSIDSQPYLHLAELYKELQRNDEAVCYADKAMQLCSSDKDKALALRVRGHINQFIHNYDKAVEDFYRSLTVNPDNISLWFSIGKIHRLAGDSIAAEKAFAKGKHAVPAQAGKLNAEQLIAMGKYDEAVELVGEMIKNPESAEEHYNAACVYAQAGRQEDAIRELGISLENGFRDFYHIVWDSDLDNIRAMPEFIALVNRYKELAEKEKAQLNELIEKL